MFFVIKIYIDAKMNGYLKIFTISIILLIISIIIEINYPYIDSSPTIKEYICIYFIRFLHYYIYLLSSFYLIFFNGIGAIFDMYIYLILIFTIVFGWFIFDSCWLSYFELLFYNINLELRETTFHPTFYSIYSQYVGFLMKISGVFYIATVSVILYYLKNISINYRIIYFIVFLFLFIKPFYDTRIKKQYYSEKNRQLSLLKKLHHKLNMV
jgi:hypothetical protein